MTAEPHPQRCLHSHICKWNKDNYQDCINTDCASHRYTYSNHQQSEQEIREKVLDEFKNWVIHDLVFCDSIGADHMFSHELILDKIDKLRSQQGERK